MEHSLKRISESAVPRALQLAERYRLLNEPDQAASICRDVLEADPGNQTAVRMLLLSLTDQFGKRGADLNDVESCAADLASEYEQAYYRGVIYERWARWKLQEGIPAYLAGDWLKRAMSYYEAAEKLRPEGDDSAILRWNTCARLIQRTPELVSESLVHELHLGD